MTLERQSGPQALLDLEDAAPEVLSAVLPGTPVPLWPLVRYHFAHKLQELDYAFATPAAGTAGPGPLAQASTLARAFAPSRWDVRRLRGQRDILFLVGGSTVFRTPAGVRNWLVDDLAEALPERTAIVQWRGLPHPDGPPVFPLTRSLDGALTRVAAAARLRGARDDGSQASLRALLTEYARLVDPRIAADTIDALEVDVTYRERQRRGTERVFARLLDRVRPRVVVMEDAGYGYWTPLIALMKRRGIHVVEPQHGWIGPSHTAYNFGAAMAVGALADTVPDELLTFGVHWADGLRFPGRISPIGKPHLEAQAAAAAPTAERPHEVLVISSTNDEERTTALIRALVAALDDSWTVRFRPHPVERPTVASLYPGLVGDPHVVIDDNDDIAVSLRSARGVIGGQSTGVFEAAAMGCRIFPLENAMTPFYLGDLFGDPVRGPSDAPRIARELTHDATTPPAVAHSLWRPGAIGNYRDWVAERVG